MLIRSVYSCSHCQECVPLPFPRSPHQNTLSAASPSTVLASGRGLAHDAWLDACGWSRRTVLCQNSVCEGAAKGGIFWDNDVCSVCDGTIDRWPRQNPSENPASPLGYVEPHHSARRQRMPASCMDANGPATHRRSTLTCASTPLCCPQASATTLRTTTKPTRRQCSIARHPPRPRGQRSLRRHRRRARGSRGAAASIRLASRTPLHRCAFCL